MIHFIIAVIAGIICGIISGLGIGGGSILMVWLTAAVSMEQQLAQGINLLYFLPTAGASLLLHTKNKLVRWEIAIPSILLGCITAAGSAWVATMLEATFLRKLFGIFLLIVGVRELLYKEPKTQRDKNAK